MGTEKHQAQSAYPFSAKLQSHSENKWRRVFSDVKDSHPFIVSRIGYGIHTTFKGVKKWATKQLVEIERRKIRTEVRSWRRGIRCKGKSSWCIEDECLSIQVVRALSVFCSKSFFVRTHYNYCKSIMSTDPCSTVMQVYSSTCLFLPLNNVNSSIAIKRRRRKRKISDCVRSLMNTNKEVQCTQSKMHD